MWDDNEWQYHQDARDAAIGDGAIALVGLVVAVLIAIVLGNILF